MFAPKVAKPQTKAPADSTNNQSLHRTAPMARPVGSGAVEQTRTLEKTIEDQTTLRYLTQRLSNPLAKAPGEHRPLEDVRVTGQVASKAWDFSKIPLFLPDRPNQPQALSTLAGPSLPSSIQPKLVQAKLAVSGPGDEFEQEADRVAERVMRLYAPQMQPTCGCNGGHQQCKAGGLTRKPERIRNRQTGVRPAVVPQIVYDVLSSPGQPLDGTARSLMASRFGHDFSRVRVHADPLAGRSAEAVEAQAYTLGSHIVFGPGRYEPRTGDGQRLLAHELAHVLQQSSGGDPVLARQPVPTKPSLPATAKPAPKPEFHPTKPHDHKPSGRWADVQAAPNSDFFESEACKHLDPEDVMRVAGLAALHGKWIAVAHFKWFFNGGGTDFVENANLDLMLRTDAKVQAKLGAKIPTGQSSGIFSGQVTITQDNYDDEDFQFAFGEIDRLDFTVDFVARTLHAWFQDRYEWHPVYPFYTKYSDDYLRGTNCVHAAAVELKSGTARDFWMKGEATVPLTTIQSAAARWHDPDVWGPGGIFIIY
jgi:hypothetical protein